MATDHKMVVPVINLANFPMELEKLAAAATGLGCFRVINHGMPPVLMDEMKAVTRSLFQLPAEAKLRSVNNNIHAGSYISPSQLGFFEAFSIHDASSMTDIRSFCSVLDTTTQQLEIISTYIEKLHGVIINIASKVAESVGYSLAGFSFYEWSCLLRLNFYNFTVEEDIGRVGAHIHTDSGFLSVLQEDECVGGFEIMNSNGNFVSVDPVPGTFIVNIGDVGKVWSNGRLQNVKHRVICKEAKPRISINMFLLAAKDDKVETEATFVDSEHPKIYQTFMLNEYRKLRDKSGFRAGEILPLL
ncbi:Naringenin,2-oxoglutarate 3-dioxygenase [Platanthera guangdongensis]|uniref:Naringenin,2-oxoglutarate 3-dioxygenase n=1 Tax=Platanthera guangdongensis TaxID=2320717 RepID=A0ABR2MGV2_9ASPA